MSSLDADHTIVEGHGGGSTLRQTKERDGQTDERIGISYLLNLVSTRFTDLCRRTATFTRSTLTKQIGAQGFQGFTNGGLSRKEINGSVKRSGCNLTTGLRVKRGNRIRTLGQSEESHLLRRDANLTNGGDILRHIQTPTSGVVCFVPLGTATARDRNIVPDDRSAVKRCGSARSLSTVPGSPLFPLTGSDRRDSVRRQKTGSLQKPCQRGPPRWHKPCKRKEKFFVIQLTTIAVYRLTAGDQSVTDQCMNNTTKPGAVLPPANFYIGLPRDNAVAGRMHVSDLDFVETLFSDDEAIGDREEYFDTYAFQIWNQQEHNEYDCALQHLIWEAYNTADY
jgi:hypothetical protein